MNDINHLKTLAILLALKMFLPWLKGHVLVRKDKSTVVAYINRHGGLRSSLVTHSGTLCICVAEGRSCTRHSQLQCGSLIQGRPTVCRLEISPCCGNVSASVENTQSPFFFSLHDQKAPVGVDMLAHEWLRTLLYTFTSIALIPATLARVRQGAHYDPDSSTLAREALASRYIFQLLTSPPWPPLCTVSRTRRNISPQP